MSIGNISNAVESLEHRLLFAAELFPPVQRVAGNEARDMLLEDFDGNGSLDIVVVSRLSLGISFFRNDGNGNFSVPVNRGAGQAVELHAFDLEGDGDLDLLARRFGSISTYANDGQGNFASGIQLNVTDVSQVATGDFDGDGYGDVVLTQSSNGNVTLLRNTRTGGFVPSVIANLTNVSKIQAADLNQDGSLDLILTVFGSVSGGHPLYTILNLGEGVFAGATGFGNAGVDGSNFLIGRLDADQLPDVLAQVGGSGLSFINAGAGLFMSPRPANTGLSLGARMGDVDNDGDSDLLGPGSSSGMVLARNSGQGAFSTVFSTYVGELPTCQIGDVDGDGDQDLTWVIREFTTSRIFQLRNDGHGNFDIDGHFIGKRAYDLGMVVADFDGDDKPDVLTRVDSGAAILLNRGLGAFEERVFGFGGAMAATDVDADGDLDVVLRDGSDFDTYHNNGLGMFSLAWEQLTFLGGDVYWMDGGDFNGDGRGDIVVANNSPGAFPPSYRFSVRLNDGVNGFNESQSISKPSLVRMVRSGDVDSDGDLDLCLVSGNQSRSAEIRLNQGNGSFAAGASFSLPLNANDVRLEDLDSDGDLDLVTGGTPGLAVAWNSGLGAFGSLITFPAIAPYYRLAVDDFDGDGDRDVVTASAGSISFVENVANTFNVAVQYSLPGYNLEVGAADFDGDGAVDVAVSRGLVGPGQPIGFGGVGLVRNRRFGDRLSPSLIEKSHDHESSAHQLHFRFSEMVGASISAADLFVVNRDSNEPRAVGAVSYTQESHTASFRLESPVEDGNYRATLVAGSIADASGNLLLNDEILDFFILAGDANRDRTVNISDFAILAGRFNLPGSFSQGDFNYDGVTNISDFAILASKFNTTLPAPSDLPRNQNTTRAAQSPSRAAPLWNDRRVIELVNESTV